MSNSASASVPTPHASRYLQQLCKHWAHNLEVSFTPERGTVVFPRDNRGADHPGDGVVTFEARADLLEVRIEATSPEQLDGLKGTVARHLDRFAFREAPLPFDWAEDIVMLEAQQRSIEANPDLKLGSFNIDQGAVRARKILARAIRANAGVQEVSA